MSEIHSLSVATEDEAWKLLEQALSNNLPKGTIQLDFGDWCNSHIKLNGKNYNSTITPGLMESFIELQKSVFRTYAKLHYKDVNHRLTDSEKKSLEIHVKVDPGSSDLTAIIENAIKALTEGAINKMEAHDYVITILGCTLLWTANTMWKNYLQNRSQLKQADLEIKKTTEETNRLEIMGKAMNQNQYLQVLSNDVDDFRNSVIKNAKSAESMLVADTTISQEQAIRLVRTSRSQSEELRIDGEYRITKVDLKSDDVTKVYLEGCGYKEFQAKLDPKAIISSKNLELIQSAEWGKKPIRLSVEATRLRGDITSATIIDVPSRYDSKLNS